MHKRCMVASFGCSSNGPRGGGGGATQFPPAVGLEQWGDVRGLFAARRPLLVDAASLVYTDGSVITTTLAGPSETATSTHTCSSGSLPRLTSRPVTVAGAGVYIPPQHSTCHPASAAHSAHGHEIHENVVEQHISVDPGNNEGACTITRAEGSAIWFALRQQLGTSIATDSAVMLYQISNMLMRPHSMRHNTNLALVTEVVDAIRQSPVHVRLYKVKAHTGIPGNEHADQAAGHAARQMARAAALGTPDMGNDEHMDCGHGPNIQTCTASHVPPSHSLFWPHAPAQLGEATSSANAAAPRPLKPVPDLRRHLKTAVHAVSCLGYTNTDSIYYQSWTQATARADVVASNAFVQRCTDAADGNRRKLTLHYRTGGLNTAKFRHRMKKATTPNCLLCGQVDGGHHSLSGCPHLSGLYTNRHNGAGKLILRYIRKGSKGASVVMHDVGKHDAQTQGSASPNSETHVGARIPTWVYATRTGAMTTQSSSQWNSYRPDIMMVTGGPRKPVHKRHVHIVEIKYCRDTEWQRQEQRATNQHDVLADHLARIGYQRPRIHRHTILLGVGGTIYKDMHTALQQVGVNKRRGKLLASKLHRHAIAQIEIIMHTKWHQESHIQQTRTGVG
jgi:ribonuclease HI